MSLPIEVLLCPNFELLFSEQDAILTFDCADLPFEPESAKSIIWQPTGWRIAFQDKIQQFYEVDFLTVPDHSLDRVAQYSKVLILALIKSNSFQPNIVMNEELPLPDRLV